MSLTAFLLISASAFCHASWNTLAKKNKMSVPYYTLIGTFCTLCWIHVQFWTPVRLFQMPLSFWLFTVGSVAADLLYSFGLFQTYKRMEMTTAYPIMRSLPILLTAAFTTLFGWGKPLSAAAITGFVIVFAGAMMMPLGKFSDFKLSRYWTPAMLFILITAFGTTWYTICDSLAMREMSSAVPEVSKTVRSITYYSTRGILLCLSLWVCSLALKSNRQYLAELWHDRNKSPLLAGLFASITYVLVLLSMNFVTNVSYVQVFRQLGLPFGMFLGVAVLKEHSAPVKWVGVSLILGGLAVSVLQF